MFYLTNGKLDEKSLIAFLDQLDMTDFGRVLVRLDGADKHIPRGVSYYEQVAALVTYMRSSTGGGLERLAQEVSELWPNQRTNIGVNESPEQQITTVREAAINNRLEEALTYARQHYDVHKLIESFAELSFREKGELYERVRQRKTGSPPTHNPFKVRCDACRCQVYELDTVEKEVSVCARDIDPHEKNPLRVIEMKVHVCQSCAAPDRWEASTREIQHRVVGDAMSRRQSAGSNYRHRRL